MPKKKSLADHCMEAFAKYDGPCTKKKRCQLLTAVVAIHAEKGTRPAFEDAVMFSMKTGKQTRSELVYFVRNGEYAVVAFCPFCGGKLR